MITQSSGAQRAATPNLETRTSPRAERGTDFHEEVARGRERDRASERGAQGARDASSARRDVPTENADVDPHDRPLTADDPSTPSDGPASTAGEQAPTDTAPTGAHPEQLATAEPIEATAGPRKGEPLEKAASPTAPTDPALVVASAPITSAIPLDALDPARDLETRMQAHAASGEDAPLDLSMSSSPAARVAPLETTSPTGAAVAARPAAESAAVGSTDLVRDVTLSSTPKESGSSAVPVNALRAPSIAEVAPTAPTPPPPRLTPAEVPQFLQTLAVRVDGSAGHAFVELEPPELGRLTVEISLQPDGGVRADVRAERQDGYAALGARIQEMRTAFIDRGFTTADVQLSFGLTQRDSRPGSDSRSSRRSHGENSRALDTERVLALAPPRTGSIDVWA